MYMYVQRIRTFVRPYVRDPVKSQVNTPLSGDVSIQCCYFILSLFFRGVNCLAILLNRIEFAPF